MEKENFNPFDITKPHKKLLKYFFIISLFSGPFFPIIFIPLWLKFKSLEYKFDENGLSMSWGILFRQETHLTFERIQDIHLSRNIIQRWMGLSKLEIQTASGSSEAEMSIEGIIETEELRDFLYSQMKGAKQSKEDKPENSPVIKIEDESLTLLKEIRDLLHLQNEGRKNG